MQTTTQPCFSGGSQGLLTADVVRPGACRLRRAYAINLNAAPRYLLLFDSPNAPQAGDRTANCFVIQGGSAAGPSEFYGAQIVPDEGIDVGTGLSYALSQTPWVYDPATVVPGETGCFLVGSER